MLALALVLLDVVSLERLDPGLPEHGRKCGLVAEVFGMGNGTDTPSCVHQLRGFANSDLPPVPDMPDFPVAQIPVEGLRPVPDGPLVDQRVRHVRPSEGIARGHRGDLLEAERHPAGRELAARLGDPSAAALGHLIEERSERPVLGIHEETKQVDRLASPSATHFDSGNQLDPAFGSGPASLRNTRHGVVVRQRQHRHAIPRRRLDGRPRGEHSVRFGGVGVKIDVRSTTGSRRHGEPGSLIGGSHSRAARILIPDPPGPGLESAKEPIPCSA